MLLDYKDVCLIPKVISQIESRNDVNTNIKFGNLNLTFPIIAAPMPDVCNGEMALKLSENGGLGIIHRFQSIESQVAEFNLVGPTAGAAIGINGDWETRFNTLAENGCNIFCIDVANGASTQLIKVVDRMHSLCGPSINIIAGNVASAEGYRFLCNIGVDAVRAGIAGGCFVKNTKVKTKNGYKNIQDIIIGEEVLTHTGEYKTVTATMSRLEKETLINVNNIICTKNHEFYVLNKKYKDVVNNENLHNYAVWVSAEELSEDYFLIKQHETPTANPNGV